MRGRSHDPDLWGELYDRFRGPGASARRRGTWSSPLPPGSSERLYDAALGVLASVRTLVDVAEEVLEDRRARLGEPEPGRSPWVRNAEEPARRAADAPQRSDVVRDIPLAGA
jgi:hypothetical protein